MKGRGVAINEGFTVRIQPPRWTSEYLKLLALAATWGVRIDLDQVIADVVHDTIIDVDAVGPT